MTRASEEGKVDDTIDSDSESQPRSELLMRKLPISLCGVSRFFRLAGAPLHSLSGFSCLRRRYRCGELLTNQTSLSVSHPTVKNRNLLSRTGYLQIQTFPLGVSATMSILKLYRAKSRRKLNFLCDARALFGRRKRLSNSVLRP